MSVSMTILFAILLILAYLVSPVTLILGWALWVRSYPKRWNVQSALSFSGFIAASASAAFALWTILYASTGRFESGNVLFYRVIAWGGALSVLGIAFSIGGMWRKSPLRWCASASALGTLAFWTLATTWP
jgi:hypothetical protein